MLRSVLKAFGLGFLMPARFHVLDAAEVHGAVRQGEMVLVDVRNPDEWRMHGVPQHAETISLSDPELVSKVMLLSVQYPEKKIAISCLSGKRAEEAIGILQSNGITDLVLVTGGLNGWKEAGLPIVEYSADMKSS